MCPLFTSCKYDISVTRFVGLEIGSVGKYTLNTHIHDQFCLKLVVSFCFNMKHLPFVRGSFTSYSQNTKYSIQDTFILNTGFISTVFAVFTYAFKK